ncbi:hypothetical protein PHMEG_0007377 [Phytophthora megakarya]|uniref:Uncharacterized protein n=1 Tax=Phytophthora megakarya TaxID=4795 RepID=A0A225WLE9_9STRA|nr:hypothetical protein PHMEG_0007377 [Phytophthora megakarya]
MKDARHESLPLTASMMATYVRQEHPDWLAEYAAAKKAQFTAYQSLLRLLQRFTYRHGFTQRTSHGLKINYTDICILIN